MFLQTIDADEPHGVLIGDHPGGKPGRWLLFARIDQTETTPSAPHYACEITDPITHRIMARWFTARRDSWRQWGEKAESIGPEQFAIYLRTLMVGESLEDVVATEVEFSPGGRSITIRETLVGVRGERTEIMFRHRFTSPEAGTAFYHWFNAGHIATRSETFVKLGYAKGGTALAALLNRLAADEMEKPRVDGSKGGRRPASGRYN